MATFSSSATQLTLTLELDTEPPGLDLTAGGLGDRICELAEAAMGRCLTDQAGPDGTPWPRLKAATIDRKGHDLIGIHSGSMAAALNSGARQIEPRRLVWSFPRGQVFTYAQVFQNGRPSARAGQPDPQPPRPIVGWTAGTRAQVRQLLNGF